MLSRYKSGLVALFERVHELQADPTGTRLLALEIQEELLLRIGRGERVIRRTRDEIDQLKCQLTQRGNDRETSRRIKTQRLARETKIETQKEVLAILRAIGDAIAFIYGDRWDLKQLVKRESSGFITGKRGTRFERHVLRQVFHTTRDAVAVLNDLTHTLRYGDITIFSPTVWPEGRFRLVELKSGRDSGSRSRIARQSDALNRVSNYLQTDARQAEDGSTWRRVSLMSSPEHHFDPVARMTAELPRAGWLLQEIEPGLQYGMIEYKDGVKISEEMFGPILKKPRQNYLILLANDMKYQHSLAYYPFPLCFRDPESLFRFYNGELLVYVVVDMKQVNEILAPHGLSARLSDRDHFSWQIVALTDEEDSWHISSHMVGRLAGEFLRLDWLLDNTVISSVAEAVRRHAREVKSAATYPSYSVC